MLHQVLPKLKSHHPREKGILRACLPTAGQHLSGVSQIFVELFCGVTLEKCADALQNLQSKTYMVDLIIAVKPEWGHSEVVRQGVIKGNPRVTNLTWLCIFSDEKQSSPQEKGTSAAKKRNTLLYWRSPCSPQEGIHQGLTFSSTENSSRAIGT